MSEEAEAAPEVPLEQRPNMTADELEEPEDQETIDAVAELAATTAEHVKEEKVEHKEHTHLLTLDVCPEEEDTDLAKLTEKVKSISMDGLKWLESHLENVVYDVNKIRLSAHVVHGDGGPSIDLLREEIEKIEGVQSTDVVHYKEVKKEEAKK